MLRWNSSAPCRGPAINTKSRCVRPFRVLVLAATLHLVAAAGATADCPDQQSFRVFLRDGTAAVSCGEWARVNSRVIFSTPTGPQPGDLQVVNLPESAVDWSKTDQYAVSVRAAQYASSRGEADYAELTAMVARTLTLVRERNSPIERLQLVEQTHGIVATWGRDHYGYRAGDVRQIVGLLDEVISTLRADAGLTQFDLNLVATVDAPPPPVMPKPTPAEAIAQVLGLAEASDNSDDRVALFRAGLRMLDRDARDLPPAWTKRTRDTTAAIVVQEGRTDRAYRDLGAALLPRAHAAAARADAAAVEAILEDLRAEDVRLGNRRPAVVANFAKTIEDDLETARRLRLARDRWQLQQPALTEYQRRVRQPLRELANVSKTLDAIRRLSGPDPAVLLSTRQRLARASLAVQAVTPPEPAALSHATLSSACQMALLAVDLRERAIRSGDLQVAWDASSAAAGAGMLIARARDEVQAARRAPAAK